MARKSRKPAASPPPPPDSAPSWRAGGYCRLSVEDERHPERHTLEHQQNLIRDFLARRPEIRLCRFYLDNGESGTRLNRPGFQRLMEDLRNGTLNCIVVKDLSRFARNFREAGFCLEELFPRLAIRFISIQDDYDSLSPRTDWLAIPAANLLHEWYARDISLKVRSALERKRIRGDCLLSRPPYGYLRSGTDRPPLVPDPRTAPVVRRIFRARLSGRGEREIARHLTEQEIPPPAGVLAEAGLLNVETFSQCRVWHHSTVHRILRNPVYAGDLAQGKTDASFFSPRRGPKPESQWVVLCHSHEPLVDPADFEAVQALLPSGTVRRSADG